MSNVIVALPSDTERKLREKAGAAGLTLETYLGRLAESDALTAVPLHQAAFDDMLAPVRKAFVESGLTDDDLTELVQEAREEVWQDKLARTKS